MKYGSEKIARIYVCQEYSDIGAVEADSREDALLVIREKAKRSRSGTITPSGVAPIESLEEFLDRALGYWEN
jgi:hypothetical protein